MFSTFFSHSLKRIGSRHLRTNKELHTLKISITHFWKQFCWISQHPKNRKHEHQRFQHFCTTVELRWESWRFVLVWARDKGLGQVSSKTSPFSALGCILLSFDWHHLQYLSLSHLHRSWVKPRALKKAWLDDCLDAKLTLIQSIQSILCWLSFAAGSPPITPPEVEVNRRRKAAGKSMEKRWDEGCERVPCLKPTIQRRDRTDFH